MSDRISLTVGGGSTLKNVHIGGYRDSAHDLEIEALRKENARLRSTIERMLGEEWVDFDGACPGCGSMGRVTRGHPSGLDRTVRRRFVHARKRWFRPTVAAHFEAECAECGATFRERLKGRPEPRAV